MFGGLHGSLSGNIDKIVETGELRPGKSLHDWLGRGAYLYAICQDPIRGSLAGFEHATGFARRKFPEGSEIGCVFVELNPKSILNLQQPEIRRAFDNCDNIVQNRLEKIGLQLEPLNNWVRQHAHLSIDIFLEVLNHLSPYPIYAVQSEFRGSTKSPIEEIKNPELCIKNPAAILNIRKIQSASDIPADATRAAHLISSNLMIKSAQQAEEFLSRLDDHYFADLLIRVCGGEFGEVAQFRQQKRMALVLNGQSKFREEIERKWHEICAKKGQTCSIVELEDLRDPCGPEELRKIEQFTRTTDRIAIFSDASENSTHVIDVTLSSLLSSAKSSNCSLLVLANGKSTLPCELRSTQRISVFKLSSDKKKRIPQVGSILAGFVGCDWRAQTQINALELMHAARAPGCKLCRFEQMLDRHAAFKKILEFDTQQSLLRELPGLQTNFPDETHLEFSDPTPAVIARDIRGHLGVEGYEIKTRDILRALGDPKVLPLDMQGSGFLVQGGPLKLGRIVALREKDGKTRQRFTLAHELGHVILNAATWQPEGDIEDWCDTFAANLLMPADLISKFIAEHESLERWLDLPKLFDVSFQAIARSAWERSDVMLLRYPKGRGDICPRPADAALLYDRCKNVGLYGLRGQLPSGIPFSARRDRAVIEIVVDYRIGSTSGGNDDR